MGFKMRKSFKAGPVRVNLSKSGIGYSVGGKGFRYTKKAGGGHRTTVGIPGTGISYSKGTSGKTAAKSSRNNNQQIHSRTTKKWTKGTLRIMLGVCYFVFGIIAFSENTIHGVISFLVGAFVLIWGLNVRKKTIKNSPDELSDKLRALSSAEFEEYKETLLRYIQNHKDSAHSPDMQKLIKAVREEDERRGAQK